MAKITRRKPPDVKPERKIITGLIVSDEFCKSVLPILKSNPKLLRLPYSQEILKWIIPYWDQYGNKPPFKHIQDLFSDYENEGNDPDQVALINEFLSGLSTEYEEDKNPKFEIDKAFQYLNRRHIEEFEKAVSDARKKNDLENAQKLIQDFIPLRSTEQGLLTKLETNITTSTKFIKKRIEPPEMIISPWLTDGSLSMIFAPRGVGKTWLSLIIAIAVTRDNTEDINIGPWKVEERSGVLYVDGEMNDFDLQKRLIGLKIPLGKESSENPLRILSASNFAKDYRQQVNISTEEWRNSLWDYLYNHDEFQLLILDNIAALTPGVDEDKKLPWDPINQWLLSLRHLGVSVIFVHHTGKSGQQRGTSGREDALDCVLTLTRPEGYHTSDGAFFNIKFDKSRNVEPGADLKPFSLRIQPSDDGIGLIWTTEDVRESVDKEIITALIIDGKLKQKDIAKIMGVSAVRISQIKKEAITKECLDRKGNSTNKGRELIKDIDLSIYYGEDEKDEGDV